MTPKFEIKRSRNKKFFFVLVAANGKTIAQSEMYDNKQGALTGIESVRSNANAEIVDTTSISGI